MGWKRGPLPKDTYMWGGVVTFKMLNDKGKATGFLFADFHGDHVKVEKIKEGKLFWERVESDEVAWYNNCLELPIKEAPEIKQRIGIGETE